MEDRRGFRVVGDIERSSIAAFADALAIEIAHSGDIVLDLREANFADSSGMGIIVSAAEDLGSRGDLILILPEESRDVLEMAASDLPNLMIL